MLDGTERNILVVDDEAPIRTLLRAAVGATGYEVYEADSGAKAMELAGKKGPFALVVSDIVMPGMDGFELAHRLVSSGYAEAFLFTSGYFDEENVARQMKDLPRARYLSKPFDIPDLLRAIRELTAQTANPRRPVRRAG